MYARSLERSPFSITCSKDLLVQTSHGGHGYRNLIKETNQAKITEILQFDALLVALRNTLAFEDFVQNLQQ